MNEKWSPADKLILALIEIGTVNFYVEKYPYFNLELYSISIESDSIYHRTEIVFNKDGYPFTF